MHWKPLDENTNKPPPATTKKIVITTHKKREMQWNNDWHWLNDEKWIVITNQFTFHLNQHNIFFCFYLVVSFFSPYVHYNSSVIFPIQLKSVFFVVALLLLSCRSMHNIGIVVLFNHRPHNAIIWNYDSTEHKTLANQRGETKKMLKSTLKMCIFNVNLINLFLFNSECIPQTSTHKKNVDRDRTKYGRYMNIDGKFVYLSIYSSSG